MAWVTSLCYRSYFGGWMGSCSSRRRDEHSSTMRKGSLASTCGVAISTARHIQVGDTADRSLRHEIKCEAGAPAPASRPFLTDQRWIWMLPPINLLGPLEYVVVLMLNVSSVPGSPQSSTSTVNGSVVVPVARITEAVPVNVACVFGPQEPPVICSASIDCALMRTLASWSLYSRFPLAGQQRTANPKVALPPLGLDKLGTNAGNEMRSPSGEKTGSSPGICPPPVTLPGVEAPPMQAPTGAGAVSQGV